MSVLTKYSSFKSLKQASPAKKQHTVVLPAVEDMKAFEEFIKKLRKAAKKTGKTGE